MWLLFEVGVFFGGLIRKRGDHPEDSTDEPGDQPPATQP